MKETWDAHSGKMGTSDQRTTGKVGCPLGYSCAVPVVSERMACLETKVCKWTGTRESGSGGIAALVLLPLLLVAKLIPPG